MSDWRETPDTKDQDTPSESGDARMTQEGINSMQGLTEQPEQPDTPDQGDDLLTVHPRKNLETLPSPEIEPITIKNPEDQKEDSEGEEEETEGKITMPKGWRPGGPEAW